MAPVRRFLPGVLALIVVLPALAAGPRGQESRPLPDQTAFLAETAKRLRSNDLVRSRYVYRQTDTRLSRDSDGRVTKTEVKVYEVFPAPEDDLTYRRLVLVDGVRPGDLEEKDRKQIDKIRKWVATRQREGVNARQARLRKQAEAERREAEVVDEVLALYRITMTGRETVAGRPAIAVTLDPRPDYQTRTREAGIIKKFKGRAWIDEQDHELARLELEVMRTVSVGLGIVARLAIGSRAVIERRKVNDEAWLPTRSHFVGSARILLVKRVNVDQLSDYTDYRKAAADIITDFTFPK